MNVSAFDNGRTELTLCLTLSIFVFTCFLFRCFPQDYGSSLFYILQSLNYCVTYTTSLDWIVVEAHTPC